MIGVDRRAGRSSWTGPAPVRSSSAPHFAGRHSANLAGSTPIDPPAPCDRRRDLRRGLRGRRPGRPDRSDLPEVRQPRGEPLRDRRRRPPAIARSLGVAAMRYARWIALATVFGTLARHGRSGPVLRDVPPAVPLLAEVRLDRRPRRPDPSQGDVPPLLVGPRGLRRPRPLAGAAVPHEGGRRLVHLLHRQRRRRPGQHERAGARWRAAPDRGLHGEPPAPRSGRPNASR